MTRIALAAVALAALSGVSQAQQAPQLVGDYAANVIGTQTPSFTDGQTIGSRIRAAHAATLPVGQGSAATVDWNEVHSGR